MSKTSSAVKDRYNAKAYDKITLRLAKGNINLIATRAKQTGESVNGMITRLIRDELDSAGIKMIPTATKKEQA